MQVLRWLVTQVVHDRSADILRVMLQPKFDFRVGHECDDVVKDDSIIVERHHVHDAARPYKTSLAVKLIDTIRATTDGENIVVFSTRHEALREVQALRPGELFLGSSTTEQRFSMQSKFAAQSGAVLYVATRAGGVGINLSCANRVILMDVSWNPVDDTQAISRCYRMGQEKCTFVYRLVAEGTLEERIYRLNVQKHHLASRVLEEHAVERIYTKHDLMNLTAVDDEVPELTELAVDPVLDEIKYGGGGEMSLRITDHGALFSDESTFLSGDAYDAAQNDMHGIQRTMSRESTNPDGIKELLLSTDYCFEDNSLAPPHVPFFEVTSDPLRDATSFQRKVVVRRAKQEFVYLRTGPPTANDDDIFCQLFFKKNSAADDQWTQFVLSGCNVSVMDSIWFDLGFWKLGDWVFKTRFVSKKGFIGPFSHVSAVLHSR